MSFLIDPPWLYANGRAVTRGIVRKLEATAKRLRELGVTREDAAAFGGDSW